jgi:hypothetical protein
VDELVDVLLVEDDVLEVVELDVVEVEVVVVLLTELDVPRDQKSAFSVSASLTKKWNNRMSPLNDVSKVHEMRKDCLRIWEQRIQEREFPYLWSLRRLCWMLYNLRVSMAFWGGIYELRIVS